MLDREVEYYKANENEFLERYKGRFIAIVGEEVVGVFDSELAAYEDMKKKYGLGNFLLQHCVPVKDRFIQRYHSRVAFK